MSASPAQKASNARLFRRGGTPSLHVPKRYRLEKRASDVWITNAHSDSAEPLIRIGQETSGHVRVVRLKGDVVVFEKGAEVRE